MKRIFKLGGRALLTCAALALGTGAWAADGVPTKAGEHCTFTEGVRYSQLVITL